MLGDEDAVQDFLRKSVSDRGVEMHISPRFEPFDGQAPPIAEFGGLALTLSLSRNRTPPKRTP